MSSRQASYGRGRGNRYHGSRNNYQRGGRGGNNTSSNTNKEKELKFSPHIQGSTSYATVKEAIIEYIQKNYKGGHDIAKSLKDGAIINLASVEPTRGVSRVTNADDRKLEQQGLDIRSQETLRRHLDRKDNLEQGMTRCYALIYGSYCTKTMRSRVEEHPDFSTKLEDKPLEL